MEPHSLIREATVPRRFSFGEEQPHGAAGTSNEYTVDRYLCDSKVPEIANQSQCNIIVSILLGGTKRKS
jgi:hypothetical protein